jgi:hypothetical protein
VAAAAAAAAAVTAPAEGAEVAGAVAVGAVAAAAAAGGAVRSGRAALLSSMAELLCPASGMHHFFSFSREASLQCHPFPLCKLPPPFIHPPILSDLLQTV